MITIPRPLLSAWIGVAITNSAMLVGTWASWWYFGYEPTMHWWVLYALWKFAGVNE